MIPLTPMMPSKVPQQAQPQREPRRILIVDGDMTVGLVTQHGLQAMLGDSADIVLVASPDAAWQECQLGGVALVMIDPAPHDVATDALMRRLRAQLPALPVIVVTAHDTPRLRAEVRALGVRHYLAKPALLSDLERDIRAELGLRQT